MITEIIAFVFITAYNPVAAQTDSTPLITAFNKPVKECTMAISRDLERQGFKEGRCAYIPSVKHCGGLFVVADRMHRRKREWVDVLLFDEGAAVEFGIRSGAVHLLKECVK